MVKWPLRNMSRAKLLIKAAYEKGGSCAARSKIRELAGITKPKKAMKAGYAGYESPIYEGYDGYESPEGGKGVDVSVGLLCHDKTNSNTQFNPVSTREVVCIPCYSSCRVLVAFHSISNHACAAKCFSTLSKHIVYQQGLSSCMHNASALDQTHCIFTANAFVLQMLQSHCISTCCQVLQHLIKHIVYQQ